MINRTKPRKTTYYPVIRSKYYYIIAVVRGKRFIAHVPGNPASMSDARREASKIIARSDELRNNRWEIIESKSPSMDTVRHNLQHKIWEGTGSFVEASQRMRHKL